MSKTITRKYIQRITKREGNTSIRQSSGGGGGGGGGASQYWVEENYISKLFFNQLFTVYDEDGNVVEPNDTESVIASIKSMFGFWTDAYLSALGNGEGGGAELTLDSLADVAVQGVADGQALVWNATLQKWVPGQGGGIDITAMWAALAQSGVQQIDASHLATALTGYATETWVGNQGYITGSALNGYATETWVGSQISDMATQTWVSGSYLSQTNAAATYLTQTNAAATYLTKTDAATTYVSIAFFERLFKAYNGSTVVHPNNTTSTIDNIKAMFGFWTDFYLSALGNGSGGSTPGVTMAQVWSALGNSTTEQINISHLTNALSGYVTATDLATQLASYNPTNNFKTINGNSIIGTGDINVGGGGGNYLPLSGGTMTGTINFNYSRSGFDLNFQHNGANKGDIGYWPSLSIMYMSNRPGSRQLRLFDNGKVSVADLSKSGEPDVVSLTTAGDIVLHATNGNIKLGNISGVSNTSGNTVISSWKDNDSHKGFVYLLAKEIYAGAIWPNQNNATASLKTTTDWNPLNKTGYYQVWQEWFFRTSAQQAGGICFYLNENKTGYGLDIVIDGEFYADEGQKVWHEGNFSPSDYLPLSGGTLSSSVDEAVLTINNTAAPWIWFNSNGVHHGAVGWFRNFTFIGSGYGNNRARIGVTDTGTPQYWDNADGNKYTLYHEGNFSPSSYLPLSGGTMTGDLTVTNIKWASGMTQNTSPTAFATFINNDSVNGLTYTATNNMPFVKKAGDTMTGNLRVNASIGINVAPSYALHVSGTFYASGNSSIGGTFGVTGATTLSSTLGVSGATTLSSSLSVTGNSTLTGYVGIGTAASSSYALKVSGVAYASTGFYSGGYVTALSDARHKDVKGDVGLTVEEVANAPAVKFLWKDRRQDGLQVGSIAQYWQKVMPEAIVKNADGELTMSYGVIALLASIATARKVEDHERRIKELEEENKKLKQQLNAA